MRILEGVGTLIQLGGLLARLCKLVSLFPRVPECNDADCPCEGHATGKVQGAIMILKQYLITHKSMPGDSTTSFCFVIKDFGSLAIEFVGFSFH